MSSTVKFNDPPFAQFLFADSRTAWLWLALRVWLGWEWLSHGWAKVNNPAWMDGGAALKGYWTKAVTVPEQGSPAVVYDWYRGFLQMLLESGQYTWFAKLVVFGEIAIGLALILGAFTGVAAVFGVFMNWHFVMAGTASSNAMLALTGMMLILAWKNAGWIGLDRWLLPMIGTPWQRHADDDEPSINVQRPPAGAVPVTAEGRAP